jgi:hypothetical protein
MALGEFPEMAERLANGMCPPVDCHHSVPFGRLACPSHWSLRRNILKAWNGARFVEHRRWKIEAYRFWATGKWGSDPNPAPTRTEAP